MPLREITGHRPLLIRLARAISRDSLPPSLIFAGPSGVGKRRVALAVAQAANCQAPVDHPAGTSLAIDACGACPSCQRIARGVHPDILELTPGDTGTIKIEAIRSVIERSSYRPFEGRRRFVVIDEADAVVREGQNALLKILEEPPSASRFILVTPRPDALLPTVRSRCPRLRFGPLSAADVAAVLARERGYEAGEAQALAAAANGSLEVALGSEARGLALARAAAQQALLALGRRPNVGGRLEVAKLLAGTGTRSGSSARDDLEIRLRSLGSMLRDVGLLGAGADPALLANTDLSSELEAAEAGFGGGRVIEAYAAVQKAIDALGRNASPKIVADWVALQI